MGDENNWLEESMAAYGISAEMLEQTMAHWQTKRVEAYAELKKLDDEIDQARLELGARVFVCGFPNKTKLNELKEKRENLDAYIYFLDEVFKMNQQGLLKARNG